MPRLELAKAASLARTLDKDLWLVGGRPMLSIWIFLALVSTSNFVIWIDFVLSVSVHEWATRPRAAFSIAIYNSSNCHRQNLSTRQHCTEGTSMSADWAIRLNAVHTSFRASKQLKVIMTCRYPRVKECVPHTPHYNLSVQRI